MENPSVTAAAFGPIRRIFARLLGTVSLAIFGILIAGMIGWIVRDRILATGLLMYIPLLPVGAAMVLVDLLRRGRSWLRVRFLQSSVGVIAMLMAALPMIGYGRAVAPTRPDRTVTLLHWNVLRGGFNWASIRGDIVARRPDIVVLSEGPMPEMVETLRQSLGTEWTSVEARHTPGSPYWYQLIVLSRWATEMERRVPLRHGAAMCVRVEAPDHPLRILFVDGESDPFYSRPLLLDDIRNACTAAAAEGRPIDLIAGDFNTVSRSIGFDAFETMAGGYVEAASVCGAWRATWPSYAPLYDIDHVWLARSLVIEKCDLFTNTASDHRGQLVRFSTVGH